MIYNIYPTPKFQEDIKYYKKKKKYSRITDDIGDIIEQLKNGNFIGDEIPGLNIDKDGHTYKVRAVNTDTKSGKSNGYRLIYYVIKDDFGVYLIAIYYKKDSNNIPTNKEIIDLINKYC